MSAVLELTETLRNNAKQLDELAYVGDFLATKDLELTLAPLPAPNIGAPDYSLLQIRFRTGAGSFTGAVNDRAARLVGEALSAAAAEILSATQLRIIARIAELKSESATFAEQLKAAFEP